MLAARKVGLRLLRTERVDLLPVEAPLDIMNKYKAMVFLGWNSFDENDFLRIRNYVFDGGTLVLTAAHLNAELQPSTWSASRPTMPLSVKCWAITIVTDGQNGDCLRKRKDRLFPVSRLSGRNFPAKPV